MATPGYEPHQLLWDLFHQNGSPGHTVLTPEQRKTVGSIIGYVHENRMHPEASSFVTRFKQMMMEKTGKTLDPMNEEIAQGILECLNPCQAYSPFTTTNSVTFKMGGIYDHFKGGIYLVTGSGSWASGEGELVIEYLSMIFGTKHYRLGTQWCEVVQWPDGKYRSRFVYRGPTLLTPEPPFKVPSPKV